MVDGHSRHIYKAPADYEEVKALFAPDRPDILPSFRKGGWFNRLQRMTAEERIGKKAPNFGSRRPDDIHTAVWSGAGAEAQKRELKCREAEALGESPPATVQQDNA